MNKGFLLAFWCLAIIQCSHLGVNAQIKLPSLNKNKAGYDTVDVKAGQLVLFPDTLFIPENDTIFIVPARTRVKVKENPYVQSEQFYDSLEVLSDKSLVTRKLHELLFRSSAVELSDSVLMLQSEAPFEPYTGYKIADIRITNAEFLGGTIEDTTSTAKTYIGRTLDALHADTKETIVRNSLLFEVGDLVEPFQLADNERLLRDLPFIRDSRIMLVPRVDEPNMVDVYVITQDRLSLFVDGDFDGFDDFTLEVGSRNIFGTGNQFSVAYQYARDESPQSGYELKLKDFNIRGTFITGSLTYSDFWDREGYEISFQREFLTPQTKWAGGVDVGDLKQIHLVDLEGDSVVLEHDSLRIPYQNNFQDVWLGYSFLLSDPEERKNFIVSTRVFRQDFTERPAVTADSNYFFHNGVLWLNQFELTKRKYLKSTMIQAFGITEDIPIGYQAKLLAGYEFGEFADRPYLGIGAGIGDFVNKIGYLSAQGEIGGFLEGGNFEEGVAAINGLYFSPLLKLGRNKFRQFVSTNYSTVLRPLIEEPFSFKENIRGIDSEVQGNRKFSVNIESVVFHPRRLYGFRMATFLFYDFGWISFDKPLLRSENFESAIGIGFRLRNESLLFRTIQLRFGFVTGDGFNVNFSFSNPRIFSDFVSNKPEPVEF